MTLAKIDLDGALPLIIGLIWVIAQIAGAAAKKKAASRPRSADGEPGDPFAELMRTLGGVQEFQIPNPPEPVEPPAATPWKPGEIEALPNVQPIRRAPPAPDPEAIDVPTVSIRPTMSSFKTAMPSMKLPAMNLSFQTSEKSGTGLPRIGKIINPADKQTLRRAVLGHIILGKPRGMQSGSWSGGVME